MRLKYIKLGGATTANRDATNLFFLDEVEPWYLGLQNQALGSQARANYTYRAYRIARNAISVGYHVTPSTPDGDYTTEPNAVLNLRAGETIELKNGTHFKPGSEVHLKIEYFPCTD